MDEAIEVSLERIRNIIASLPRKPFSTGDVIREYCGAFCSNIGTSAHYSFNAQFGKLLKRNAIALGIVEVKKNASAKDDHDRRTSTSIWQVKT